LALPLLCYKLELILGGIEMTRKTIISALIITLCSAAAGYAEMYRYGSSEGLDMTIKGGYYMMRGESDLWQYNSEIFIYEPSDLNGFAIMVGLNYHLNSFITFSIEVGGSYAHTYTQYRDYVDEFDMPIETDIELSVVPIEVGLKFNILGRGKYIGRFDAYEKNPIIPYIGGGVGMYLWNYTEYGDYIDFANDEIVYAEFEADRVSFGAFVVAGLEIPMGRRFGFLMEYKYLWLKGDLGEAFTGFEDFDLGGQIVYIGITTGF
jgi:hypothetical protein